jgi:hypothetical protein
MRIVLRFLGFIFFSILTLSISAQVNQRFSSLSESFKFNDGIYMTIDMVRNNSPIPPNWIDADLNASNPIFYEEITKTDQIDFYDENGVRRFIRTNEVWGYCRKGVLYVHIGVKFYEIKYLGGVSFFTTLLVNGKEYLIDLMENHYWEFGVGGLEYLLERDPQLLDEFNDLKKRKKKQMRYVFLIRYNEKHPFMISPE